METSGAYNCDDDKKWGAEEEEEEEALSLCDLPVNLIEGEKQVVVQQRDEYDEGGGGDQSQSQSQSQSQAIKSSTEDQDFNFGCLGGSVLSADQPEMCAADEVFFKGQILPLRLSVSSDSGLSTRFRHQDSRRRCLSRSESMDHGSLSRFTSVSSSSRCSSTRSRSSSSHYSTSSSNSLTVTPTNPNPNPNSNSDSKSKPINKVIRNNFNSHPSPKPQLRLSKTRPVNVGNRNHKSSSMWEFFRLGLVRAPELELQDLKVRRNSVSRNSSCNSSNSSSSTKQSPASANINNINISITTTTTGGTGGEVVVKSQQQDLNKAGGFLEKRIGLFSGCKCSVNAVETIPLNGKKDVEKDKGMMYAAVEEKKKLQELKLKKRMKEKEKEKGKQQLGKQALSRHRTFEWLKELSHASYADDLRPKAQNYS